MSSVGSCDAGRPAVRVARRVRRASARCRSALGERAVAELERRVERVLRALDVRCRRRRPARPGGSGTVDRSSATSVLDLLDQRRARRRVRRRACSRIRSFDLRVVVVVAEEVLREEERRQVVVGVRVVREPAELVRGVDVGGALLGVLDPLRGLQVDREQAVLLQLVLDQRVLVARRRAVVVVGYCRLSCDRRRDAGGLEGLPSALSASGPPSPSPYMSLSGSVAPVRPSGT